MLDVSINKGEIITHKPRAYLKLIFKDLFEREEKEIALIYPDTGSGWSQKLDRSPALVGGRQELIT